MASVGRKNTSPELLLRSMLHRSGLRFRLHDEKLPGTPDLVFSSFKTVVFVHGCYWHYHGCYRSKIPETRSEFWRKKFEDNRERDKSNITNLGVMGWRCLIVWECALRGKKSLLDEEILLRVRKFLGGNCPESQISGKA